MFTNVTRSCRHRTCLIAALSLASVFNFGCGKKPSPPPVTLRLSAPQRRLAPPSLSKLTPPASTRAIRPLLPGPPPTPRKSLPHQHTEVGPVSLQKAPQSLLSGDSTNTPLPPPAPADPRMPAMPITIASVVSNEPTDTDRDRDKIFRDRVKDAYFDLDKAEHPPRPASGS